MTDAEGVEWKEMVVTEKCILVHDYDISVTMILVEESKERWMLL